MVKPRMIILIRHGHSEGNKNRAIHQTVPDHRVKLTSEGWRQAREAGMKLRSLLRPDDKLQFFTSPYRRTRETTEGILESLTAQEPGPSPFPRETIKVYEEPRLREQDFGNFQPGSDEMERIWKERAEYGHFFYRIPNGESAADAYDRISGFNESLWRQFGEEDFASVCILVTHGLMSRVFLMKWYHFSVEYFEDLRNINHCEFIVMKLNPESDKYVLQNKLRTWSELEMETDQKRRVKDVAAECDSTDDSPIPPWRKWCGCQVVNCRHLFREWRARPKRRNTQDLFEDEDYPCKAMDDLSLVDTTEAARIGVESSLDAEVARSQSLCFASLDMSDKENSNNNNSNGKETNSNGETNKNTTNQLQPSSTSTSTSSSSLSLSLSSPSKTSKTTKTTPSTTTNSTQSIPDSAHHHNRQRYPSIVPEEEPPESDPAAPVTPSRERKYTEKAKAKSKAKSTGTSTSTSTSTSTGTSTSTRKLSDKVRRMGRDGGGSNSGASGMSSSSSSASDSSSSSTSSSSSSSASASASASAAPSSAASYSSSVDGSDDRSSTVFADDERDNTARTGNGGGGGGSGNDGQRDLVTDEPSLDRKCKQRVISDPQGSAVQGEGAGGQGEGGVVVGGVGGVGIVEDGDEEEEDPHAYEKSHLGSVY